MSVQKETYFLIGMIQDLGPRWIKTRWVFADLKAGELRDVTAELCESIMIYNEQQRQASQAYAQIPYEYQTRLAQYPFGCGLSHYLQSDTYKALSQTG